MQTLHCTSRGLGRLHVVRGMVAKKVTKRRETGIQEGKSLALAHRRRGDGSVELNEATVAHRKAMQGTRSENSQGTLTHFRMRQLTRVSDRQLGIQTPYDVSRWMEKSPNCCMIWNPFRMSSCCLARTTNSIVGQHCATVSDA